MSFLDAIGSGFRNYFNFKGKATRSEFWYWVLFALLLSMVLSTLESVLWPVAGSSDDWMQNLEVTLSQPTPLTNLSSLLLLIPNLSVSARRFHDAGFSAKWLLIQLVPLAYAIFAGIGAVAVLNNAPAGQMLSAEELMSLIFLVIPIFALGAAVYVVFLSIAVRKSKSFYDGNKYVDPEPLSSMDDGTTA
jgi:uncharacterized membrane protein YhaH (DUF805 family)